METLAERHTAGRLFVMPGRGNYGHHWIAGSDFGRQVAKAFATPLAANREYHVQGPEPITYEEAALRYAHALHRSPRIIHVPLWLFRLGGVFSSRLAFTARIMQTVLEYPEVFKARATWDELGRPATTIEQFAAGLQVQRSAGVTCSA